LQTRAMIKIAFIAEWRQKPVTLVSDITSRYWYRWSVRRLEKKSASAPFLFPSHLLRQNVIPTDTEEKTCPGPHRVPGTDGSRRYPRRFRLARTHETSMDQPMLRQKLIPSASVGRTKNPLTLSEGQMMPKM